MYSCVMIYIGEVSNAHALCVDDDR